MSQGHKLHIRLFLEGIEVPVISAQVQAVANTPASATIQIIATDKILDLLPRTVVHLFFYDYVEAGNVAIDQRRELTGDDAVDSANERYKLLFMGELQSISFQKTSHSRAVILKCADFSNYWDTTYQYNFQGQLFGGRRQAAFIGANSNFFTSPLGHGTGTISRLLSGRSVNFPELRGLLAGIVRMLEAIGGSYHGRNTFRGANDFTSIAELRLKILQQITAAEKDTSTAKLFARKAFNMWMNRQTGRLGTLVSFRGLLKMMFKFIFHEVYPCPAPKFVSSGKRKEKRKTSVSLKQSSQYRSFAKKVSTGIKLLSSTSDNLDAWRTPAGDKDGKLETFLTSFIRAERSVGNLYAQGSTIGGSRKASIQKDVAVANTAMKKARSFIWPRGNSLRSDRGKSGTLDSNFPSIKNQIEKAESALKRILGIRIGRTSSKTVPTQSRVNNQIFRPDIFFAAPPRCNVLFPETYDSFSFTRQYLREVSRIELQTHNEILGNDALFNGRYYAPNVADVRRGVRLSSRRFARLILDHELFTGIIPMFENMSEANLFAMRSSKVKKAGAKVSYAQRAVNFQYFKYRFQSRTMDCSGRFNPMFVPGFPSLIIDKHMDASRLAISALPIEKQQKALSLTINPTKKATRSELLQSLVSPQYLGVCAVLIHTVNQQGGRTQYQFMQARIHRESTEFLGVDKATVTRSIGTATRKSVIGATEASKPVAGNTGPRGGRITRVRDVSKSHKGRTVQLLGQKVRVQVGVSIDQVIVGKPPVTVPSIVKAFEVTETVVRRSRETIDLPIEEAIAPPWIWDGWRSPKINATYTQFFGVTSIVDISGFNASTSTKRFVGTDRAGILKEESVKNSRRGKKSAASQSDQRSVALAAAGKHQNAVLLQDKEKTIENSIDFLVRSYSFVKINNLDVGDFLRAYSWRPIATMVEIMGGANLQIKATVITKTKVVKQRFIRSKVKTVPIPQLGVGPRVDLTKPVFGTKLVKRSISRIGFTAQGKEGFHSRAFGDIENLFGLVSPSVTRVLRLSSRKRKVAARLDVRKRRREVIRRYVEELTASQGLLG